MSKRARGFQNKHGDFICVGDRVFVDKSYFDTESALLSETEYKDVNQLWGTVISILRNSKQAYVRFEIDNIATDIPVHDLQKVIICNVNTHTGNTPTKTSDDLEMRISVRNEKRSKSVKRSIDKQPDLEILHDIPAPSSLAADSQKDASSTFDKSMEEMPGPSSEQQVHLPSLAAIEPTTDVQDVDPSDPPLDMLSTPKPSSSSAEIMSPRSTAYSMNKRDQKSLRTRSKNIPVKKISNTKKKANDSSVNQALDYLSNDLTWTDATIYLCPPDVSVLTDEDSGEEDGPDQGNLTNLSGKH